VIFKDLQKLFSYSQREENKAKEFQIFQRLQGKPFWIWSIDEHKREDIRTNGDCCLNHIIGLPQKDGADKPMYDYEKIMFDSLVGSTDTGTTIDSALNYIRGKQQSQQQSKKHLDSTDDDDTSRSNPITSQTVF
jgi:hypothetical protein